MPMNKTEALKKLWQLLTDLIDEKKRIQRLAEQSGIQTAQLNSDGAATEYWWQILVEAHRRHKVDKIVAKVGEEIGERKGDLEEAYRLYADATGDVAATLAEEKAQRKESVNLYGQAMTQLSGKQIEDLVDALIHAYPSEADLAMMVRIELNETLAAVAAGSNLRVLIFNLITWAERSGRVNELVAGAVRRTPGNPMLQKYVRRWPAVAAPTPPPSLSPSGPAAKERQAAAEKARQIAEKKQEVRSVMSGLTSSEVMKVVKHYIGVSNGYLGDFSYRTHAEFYQEYCDLDINLNQYEGTTRDKFIAILKGSSSEIQAKILRGVIARFPVTNTNHATRTERLQDELLEIIKRLESGSG